MAQDFKILIDKFIEKNSQINLSGIKDHEWIYYKHILDSLEVQNILDFPSYSNIVDIWTGWGFPMLPLACQNPDCNFTWLESKKKKTEAVNQLIREVWLNNANCIRERSENHTQQYDFLTARAVCYADKLLKQIKHIPKENWKIILYKQKSHEEYEILQKNCRKYNFRIEKIHNYKLFENDIERIIYILSKTS